MDSSCVFQRNCATQSVLDRAQSRRSVFDSYQIVVGVSIGKQYDIAVFAKGAPHNGRS